MNVAGNWKISMNTPAGTQTTTVSITEEGGVLKGTVTDPWGGAPSELESLSVEGNKLTGKVEVSLSMGKMQLEFTGTIDGDSISGNFYTPMGPIDYSGTRQ